MCRKDLALRKDGTLGQSTGSIAGVKKSIIAGFYPVKESRNTVGQVRSEFYPEFQPRVGPPYINPARF